MAIYRIFRLCQKKSFLSHSLIMIIDFQNDANVYLHIECMLHSQVTSKSDYFANVNYVDRKILKKEIKVGIVLNLDLQLRISNRRINFV